MQLTHLEKIEIYIGVAITELGNLKLSTEEELMVVGNIFGNILINEWCGFVENFPDHKVTWEEILPLEIKALIDVVANLKPMIEQKRKERLEGKNKGGAVVIPFNKDKK